MSDDTNDLFYNEGVKYFGDKEFNKALSSFEKINSKSDLTVTYLKVWCYLELENYKEAIDLYEEAEVLDLPKNDSEFKFVNSFNFNTVDRKISQEQLLFKLAKAYKQEKNSKKAKELAIESKERHKKFYADRDKDETDQKNYEKSIENIENLINSL